jgi:hypothetical protein
MTFTPSNQTNQMKIIHLFAMSAALGAAAILPGCGSGISNGNDTPADSSLAPAASSSSSACEGANAQTKMVCPPPARQNPAS